VEHLEHGESGDGGGICVVIVNSSALTRLITLMSNKQRADV